jgi:hypothetical protein
LAEFGAVRADYGFEIVEDDPHLLAWPSIIAPAASVDDAWVIREQVSKNVSNFGGRRRLIDGRPYVNMSDYRDWSERRLRSDLRCEEGFQIESFNRWTEQSEPGAAELAGICVEALYPPFSESDFVAYPDAEDAVELQGTAPGNNR